MATHVKLEHEAQRLTELSDSDPNASSSKKKRAREARKLASRVKEALERGRIEEDIKGVKMEKVFSKVSTKQAMIARVGLSPQLLMSERVIYVFPIHFSHLLSLLCTSIALCILAAMQLKALLVCVFPRSLT